MDCLYFLRVFPLIYLDLDTYYMYYIDVCLVQMSILYRCTCCDCIAGFLTGNNKSGPLSLIAVKYF